MINSTGILHSRRIDNEKALLYYQQCMPVWQELDCKVGQGGILNSIELVCPGQTELAEELDRFNRDLAICRKQGDRDGEAVSSRNIGLIYNDTGDLALAEEYIALAVKIMDDMQHPELETCRDYLEYIRAVRWRRRTAV